MARTASGRPGENRPYPVETLDPPRCLTKQQLFNYWNGDLTEQKHMRDLIESIYSSMLESYIVECSDELTPLEATVGIREFMIPYDFTITEVQSSLTTAPDSGFVQVDVNASAVSILSTPITIDNGDKDSLGANAPPVISGGSAFLPKGTKIRIDLDQTDGTATGLKVNIIGYRSGTLCRI